MEHVLYEARDQRLTRCRLGERASGIKASILALGRGVICRAGVSLPTLEPRRPARAYAYFKAPPQSSPFHLSDSGRSFLIRLANGLIILSLTGLLLTFYPVLVAEVSYRQKQISQKVNHISQNQPPVARAYFGDLLTDLSFPDPGSLLSAPDVMFSIVIPKIEARAKIIANIDSNNQVSYSQALKLGVAHAAGSSFPGKGETIWLFAHSTDAPWNITRFNAVFYLLKDLEAEDEIIVFFNGQRFNYRVTEKKIVEPTETGFLVNEGTEKLVLQTCWPPGTTLKRLIVLARPALKISN